MSLGPEVRAAAQSVFGRNLEKLESVDQLTDLIDVFEVLGENMGVEFDLLNQDDEDEDEDDSEVIDALFSTPHPASFRSGRSKKGAASPASSSSRY